MQGRLDFKYNGVEYVDGEFVLVNKEIIGYLGGVDKNKDGDEIAFVMECINRTDWMPQYCNPWRGNYHKWYMKEFSTKNGDIIEKADVMEYRLPSKTVSNGVYKPYKFLVDGWVICIILMIATLILKPLGAWQIMILITWLIIRKNEIDRCNGKRN